MARDFTYVDDIVNGVISALDYEPPKCGEVFNLGLGHPVSVPDMVKLLQKELGVKGIIDKLPLPPTEILQTWADTTLSERLLKFKPTTDLETGIKNFVVWYKGYRRQRDDEINQNMPSVAEKWFTKILEEKHERAKEYVKNNIQKHNERLKNRLEHERNKYYKWAKERNIDLPELDKSHFTFFPGADSPGGDIIISPTLKNNIEGLKKRCREAEQCIAFNTDGVLKNKLLLKNSWISDKFKSNFEGLYVSSVDMCKSDLHDCSKYARCEFIEPGQYTCTCLDGYLGNGQACLPVYGMSAPIELTREYEAVKYSIVNVTHLKADKDLIFFSVSINKSGFIFYLSIKLLYKYHMIIVLIFSFWILLEGII